MSKHIHIYCSSGFKTMQEIEELVHILRNELLEQPEVFKFHIPFEIDHVTNALVYADLKRMEQCDIMITHIPEPSVGACMEVAYFKAKYPERPILGYKCMKHPWLEEFLSFNTRHPEMIAKFLNEYWLTV